MRRPRTFRRPPTALSFLTATWTQIPFLLPPLCSLGGPAAPPQLYQMKLTATLQPTEQDAVIERGSLITRRIGALIAAFRP